MSKHHRRTGWSGSRVTEARAYWQRQIEEGVAMGVPIVCSRCNADLDGTKPWDVGHITALSEGGDINKHWPEHRLSRDCAAGGNRADGARMTNNRKRRMRAW